MGFRRDQVIEALLGTPGGLGVDPQAAAIKARRDAAAQARAEAESDSRGMSFGSKALKSIGGAYGGPAAMAAPWLSDSGDTGALNPAYSLSGPFGAAGQEGVYNAQALGGERTSGPSFSLHQAGQFIPSFSALKGAVTPKGVSPLSLGAGALQGALLALTAGATSPGGFLGAQAGSEAGGRVALHNSRSPYAGLVGSSIGGGLGGGIGRVLAPSQIAPTQPLGILGEALQFPQQLIPGASGESVPALFWNNLKANLPNVGSTSRDVLAGLNMKEQLKTQAKMQAARAPSPKPTALFGLPGLPSLGSII